MKWKTFNIKEWNVYLEILHTERKHKFLETEILESLLSKDLTVEETQAPGGKVACLELAMGTPEEEAQGVRGIIPRKNAQSIDLYLKIT